MKEFVLICFFSIALTACSGQMHHENKETTTHTVNHTEISKQKVHIEKRHQNEFSELYLLIKTSQINELFFEKISNNIYSETVLRAILWDEESINEMTILFFLKLHLEYIKKDKFGYNVSCCRQKYSGLMLLSLRYYEISGFKPTEILLTYYIYEWVITQPEYLKNIYINKVVEDIKKTIVEKQYSYPDHLKLKKEMFYK